MIGITKNNLLKFKSLMKPLLAVLLSIHSFLLPAYAVSSASSINSPKNYTENKHYKVTPQNTIISLDINKEVDYDYEVYVNPDGSFSLPFKSAAKLLDIKINQDPQTNIISFTSPSGVQGVVDYENQKITYGNETLEFKNNEPAKMVVVSQSLMPENKDDIFVPIKVLNKIFETEIKPDETNYSVSIKTDRTLKIILEYNEQQNPFNKNPKDENVIQPQKKGPVTLDTIDINSQVRLDSTKTSSADQNYQNNTVNNLSQIGLNGTLAGGVYQVNGDIHNSSTPLSFGGMGIRYSKPIKDNALQVGDISGLKSNELSVGSGVLGASYGNISDNDTNYRDISGQVEQDSKINVYINDKFYSTLSTSGGYYSLKTLPFNNEKVYKIKLEEVKPTGEIITIKEKVFPISGELQAKGQTKYEVMAGITGQDNKFLGNNTSIDNSESKKMVGGLKVSHGITDKLTVSAIGTADHIVSTPKQENQLTNDPYASMALGPYTDTNKVSGQTGIVSLNYSATQNLNVSADAGVSNAHSTASDTFKQNPVGGFSAISANYSKPDYGLSAKVYDYAKGFYLAGSSGAISDTTDKVGGEVSGNVKIKNTSLNGTLSKYTAGISNPLVKGKYNFNEYNVSSSTPLKDGSNINLNYDNRVGKSKIGSTDTKSYGANYTKRLTDKVSLSIQARSDEFSNKYTVTRDDLNNSYSDYKQLSAQLDYDLPKNLGKVNLMHDIIKASINSYNGDCNAIRVGYTTPIFKGISSSFAVGYHYTGANKGFDFSATLGYQFPSGRKFQVSYNFNRLLGSLVNNVFIPTTSHSSLTFNAIDAICLVAGGISSIGFSNTNNGYIQVITYLDLNQNGIKDPAEPSIPHIPVAIEGFGNNFTDKKGSYASNGLAEGIYHVKLNLDKLSGLIGLSDGSKSEYTVRVGAREKTKVYFGLISSIGSVSGKVNIKDEYNRTVNLKDIIVSVLNEKGEEIKYTVIDENGNYSISGLSPGKYTVKLDKDFIDNYHLTPKDIDKIITIPVSYNDYVDIKDINLDYVKT